MDADQNSDRTRLNGRRGATSEEHLERLHHESLQESDGNVGILGSDLELNVAPMIVRSGRHAHNHLFG